MINKKKLIGIAAAAAAATAGMHVFNHLSFIYSTMKGRLTNSCSSCYEWRFGRIQYKVQGQGKPLPLVHHLDYDASSYEWSKIIDELSQNHTVYALDLLGCGLSEKPRLTYTNYIYVQLLNDFVREVIKGKTDVMTSGNASSVAIMSCMAEPSLYNRLLFIQPESIADTCKSPKANHRALKYLVEIPVLGTFIYNFVSSQKMLERKIKEQYVTEECLSCQMAEVLNEAAHLGGPAARYMYASVRSHFTEIYVGNAVKKLDHSIYIIGSDDEASRKMMEEFVNFNPAVECSVVNDAKMMIQMEKPDEILEICRIFLG